MNTSTFIKYLVNNSGKELQFKLPDSTIISGDLHITEIQNHSVDSVDCGGNEHSYDETVIQLWVNERSRKEAEWSVDKAIKIVDTVGKKLTYNGAAELFIEFGDSEHSTVKYSINEVLTNAEKVNITLMVKPTACKPSLTSSKKVGACC